MPAKGRDITPVDQIIPTDLHETTIRKILDPVRLHKLFGRVENRWVVPDDHDPSELIIQARHKAEIIVKLECVQNILKGHGRL